MDAAWNSTGKPCLVQLGLLQSQGSTALPLSDATCSAGLVSKARPKLSLTAAELVSWAGWHLSLLCSWLPALQGLYPLRSHMSYQAGGREWCLATYVLGLQVLCLAQ